MSVASENQLCVICVLALLFCLALPYPLSLSFIHISVIG